MNAMLLAHVHVELFQRGRPCLAAILQTVQVDQLESDSNRVGRQTFRRLVHGLVKLRVEGLGLLSRYHTLVWSCSLLSIAQNGRRTTARTRGVGPTSAGATFARSTRARVGTGRRTTSIHIR